MSLQVKLTSIKKLHEGLEKTRAPDHKVFSTNKQDGEISMEKVIEQYNLILSLFLQSHTLFC